MSDLYDAGNSKVSRCNELPRERHLCDRGRPIYHHVYIGVRCTKSSEIKGLWLYEAALPGSRFLSHVAVRGTKSYNAQAKQVPDDQKDFHYGILYADVFPVGWHSADTFDGICSTSFHLVDYYHQHRRRR